MLEIVLCTLGIYMIVKSTFVLILKKPIKSWAARLLKNKQSMNSLAVLEIILGIILIALGYLFF